MIPEIDEDDDRFGFLVDVITETIDVLILINKNTDDERVRRLIENLKYCIIILEDSSVNEISKSINLLNLVKIFIKNILNKD